MHGGRVALVGFGLTPAVAQRLAHDTEAQVAAATEGLIKIDVVPQQPPAQAVAAFGKVTPHCVDNRDVTKWGSYLASRWGSSLGSYGYVIGASPKPACYGVGGTKPKGAYSHQKGGRYIQLMNVQNGPPQPNTSGPQMFDATVAAHELLRGFGLGHANSLVYPATVKDRLSDQTQSSDPEKHLAVIPYVEHGQAIEYGDDDSIMGSARPDITKRAPPDLLNPIELGWLKEPEVLAGRAQPVFVEIGEQPIHADAKHIYLKGLPRVLSTKDLQPGAPAATTDLGASDRYTALALVPDTGTDGQPHPPVTSFDSYLTSSTRSTLRLGRIDGGDGVRWSLGVGKKQVVITFEADGATTAVTANK